MLAEQFRVVALNTGRMREILNDPIFVQAIVCMRDEALEMLKGPTSPNPEADFNFVKGFANAIDTLLELAEPILVPEPEPEATWGSDEGDIASKFK